MHPITLYLGSDLKWTNQIQCKDLIIRGGVLLLLSPIFGRFFNTEKITKKVAIPFDFRIEIFIKVSQSLF